MAKSIPLRQCLGCREMKMKKDLVRIVRTPEGTVEYDDRGKLNGRGAYVCKSTSCFNKAVKSKAFDRALNVSMTDDIVSSVRELLKDYE